MSSMLLLRWGLCSFPADPCLFPWASVDVDCGKARRLRSRPLAEERRGKGGGGDDKGGGVGCAFSDTGCGPAPFTALVRRFLLKGQMGMVGWARVSSSHTLASLSWCRVKGRVRLVRRRRLEGSGWRSDVAPATTALRLCGWRVAPSARMAADVALL